MNKTQNHWIALYLSGQYPGFYTMPDRLSFFDEIKLENPTRFTDVVLGQYQNKNDVEFFYSLLSSFERNHLDKYEGLLVRLGVPDDVKNDPRVEKKDFKNEVVKEINIDELEKYIDGLNETDFSRYIISPLLEKLGYENIEFKGKVNETDYGLDYYPVSYKSPGGIIHYAGVQTKAKKMTSGDTVGSELNKLIEETKTAFGQKHYLNTGEQVKISEYIVFNSKEILQTARDKYFKDENIENRKIKLYGKDGVLSLINELGIKISGLIL